LYYDNLWLTDSKCATKLQQDCSPLLAAVLTIPYETKLVLNSSNVNYKSHEITEKHNDDMADLISVGGHQDADDDLRDENSQQQQRVLRNTNTYTNRNRFI